MNPSRKLNPERRPSLKKLPSQKQPQYSPAYKQLITLLDQKHTQQSIIKLISTLSTYFSEFNKTSSQAQSTVLEQAILKRVQLVIKEQNGLPLPSKLKLLRAGLESVHKMSIGNLAKDEGYLGKEENVFIEFKGMLDIIIKISQDTKNDKHIAETGLLKVLFQLLANLQEAFSSRVQKLQRKLVPERRNSMKKLAEQMPLPIIERPKSRQKLASLTKRGDGKSTLSTLNNTMTSLKQQPTEVNYLQQVVLSLLIIVKNCSANNQLKKKLLEEQCLSLLNKYSKVWDEKNLTTIGNKMLVQITSTHRHLAVQQKSFKTFLLAKTVDQWLRMLQIFPTQKQIILNLLRLFSKLSTVQQCCEILDSRQICLRNLKSFFATYKTDIYIIIRVSFIFANMTSFLVDIRNKMYFKYQAFIDIYQCFNYYITSELKGKGNDIEMMGISKMAWDFQVMKKQNDIEALVKIIRLIANLLTVSEIGNDIYTTNQGILFRDLIKKLKILLEKKPNIEANPDLIVCILSCLANALYYDKEVVLSNVDHKNTKIQIIGLLSNFIVQAENEEVCCQGLRVLSNLSRSKQFIKSIVQNQLHQATLILLESSSKEIVYYSMGVLINLLIDTEFKSTYAQKIVLCALDILNQCNNEDFDIITICSKCIGKVAKDITGSLVKEIQVTMDKLGVRCDMLMIRPTSAQEEKDNLEQSRRVINLVINDLKEDPFVCKMGECGRRFGSEVELKAHVERRHKL